MHAKKRSFRNGFAVTVLTPDEMKPRSLPDCKTLPALLAVLLLILIVAACGGGYLNPNQNQKPLVQIQVFAKSIPSVAPGGTVQLGANGWYQLSRTQVFDKDVTKSATWSTSNPAIATVNEGLVTSTGIGSVTITATLAGKTGSTTVVVGLTSTIAITPTAADPFSKSATPQQQFFAEATYSDGTVLDLSSFGAWSSNPTGILTFYVNDPGDATFVATGTTTITAKFRTGETPTVTVTVVP
jgi:hypothetical protein